jgi:hypothetical protein
MSSPPKKISNPFSSSGGGVFFESYVQASFVTLMLTEGMCPALQGCQILKVKLQSRHLGHQVDDVLVFTKHPVSGAEPKLLGQIKVGPSITVSDEQFKDTIHAAWKDFNDPLRFNEDIDALALITGHLSIVDTDDVRELLEWARGYDNAPDFFDAVKQANFSSPGKREKLKVFQHHLREANGGTDPTPDEQWRFLKSFHLLGYDLDISAGVLQALLQTLVGNATTKDPEYVWLKIVELVQRRSPTAGTFTWEHFPDILKPLFKRHSRPGPPPSAAEDTDNEPARPTTPRDGESASPIPGDKVSAPDRINLATSLGGAPEVPFPIDLAIGFLAGWEEYVQGDMEAVSYLTQDTKAKWLSETRLIWKNGNGPLEQVDRRWKLKDHKEYLTATGAVASDEHLDGFGKLAIAVLGEYNPALDEPKREFPHFPSNTPQPKYSYRLRSGISETLALVGSHPGLLPTCSTGKATRTVDEIVRTALSSDDWRVWSTLNYFLPLLAEAAPEQFLGALERLLGDSPATVKELIAQESAGLFGSSHITGMLWGLELIAWSAEHFNRAVKILAALTALDPGGSWANRPSNSLATILLPWLPQTSAGDEQRHAAVRTIVRDQPEVAWQLVSSLLPGSTTSSMLSHKPKWRAWPKEDWEKGVQGSQYRKDSSVYSSMALDLAGARTDRLSLLISRYFKLPKGSRDKLRDTLTSDSVLSLSDPQKQELWLALGKLTSMHRRFSDSPHWRVPEELLQELDVIADVLKPTAPEVRHQRLFSGDEYSVVQEHGSWEEQRKVIDEHRKEAVTEILAAGDLTLMREFAKTVQGAWHVGLTLGSLPDRNDDSDILPAFLESESENVRQLAGGYALAKVKHHGWVWVRGLDMSGWNHSAVALLLAHLPFKKDAWELVSERLGSDEGAYWKIVQSQPYDDPENIHLALQKLIDHERADEALMCMFKMMLGENAIPNDIAIHALLEVKSSERLGGYELGKLIGHIQKQADIDPNTIRRIEWKFMPVLGELNPAKPTLLSRGLADDPSFFCEVIRAMYRSEKEPPSEEEPTQAKRDVAMNAYRLLKEWDIPPGKQADGTFDDDAFRTWLAEVKRSTVESGHLSSALYQIGEMLFHTPTDPKTGLWPPSVCEALDVPEHDRMREGLHIEIFNRRGVHSPSGGAEERAISEQWKSVALEADKQGYSTLATSLRGLAKSYAQDADREAKGDLDI